MTQTEKLRVWLGVSASEASNEKLELFLSRAEDAIKRRRNQDYEDPMEPQFSDLQLQIAVYLFNKQGAEGETSHSENGVSRGYENSDIPETLLAQIIPLARIAT